MGRREKGGELRASDELHRVVLSSISDAVFITDDVGGFTYICPNVHTIFGFSYDEVRGFRNIQRLLGGMAFSTGDLATRGEIENVEWDVLDKNGVRHDLLVNVKRVSIRGGTVLYTCRDVTERKKVESALAESEIRYRCLFEDSPIPLWEADFGRVRGRLERRLAEDGVEDVAKHLEESPGALREILGEAELRDANVAMVQLYGARDKEHLIECWHSVLGEDMFRFLANALVALLRGQGHFAGESATTDLRGRPRSLAIHVSIPPGYETAWSRVLISASDITDKLEAEQRVRSAAARATGLAEISQRLAGAGLEYGSILEVAARGAGEMIGDWCVVRALSEEGDALVPAAVHHRLRSEPAMHVPQPIPFKEGLNGYVTETGRVVFIPVFSEQELRRVTGRTLLREERHGRISTLMVAPLRTRGETVGTIWLSRDRPEVSYSDEDCAFLQDLAGSVSLALQNARLFKEVQEGRSQLRELTRQVVSAQEEERARIARELHDEAGQSLTALKIYLELLQGGSPGGHSELTERIREAVHLTEAAMDRIRSLAQDLRPPALDAVGLDATLEGFCQEFAKRTQLAVEYRGTEAAGLSNASMACLYRFLQEGLTNAVKHSRAKRVRVTLEQTARDVRLTVNDDGCGFATRLGSQGGGSGLGLAGMRERLELLDGRLEIASAPGEGTALVALLPRTEATARTARDGGVRLGPAGSNEG